MTIACPDVTAVLLAGGLARRMGGGDKCLRPLGTGTILSRVIERIRPQVGGMVLNANDDAARFAAFALPVVADVVTGFAGPLAGILSGMVWAAEHRPETRWLLSVPTDAPFLPMDLVERLRAAVAGGAAALACATSGDQVHPVVGLWPLAITADLRQALTVEDVRKIDRFTARYHLAVVAWPAVPIDPFFNANSPDDLAIAERLLRG